MSAAAVIGILNDTERIRKRDKKSYAQVARELGLKYHKLHSWLHVRRYFPDAEGILLLQQWCNDNLLTERGQSRRKLSREKAKRRRERLTTWPKQ